MQRTGRSRTEKHGPCDIMFNPNVPNDPNDPNDPDDPNDPNDPNV
jgi:hypothetical protein